jgi:hypothetical protein
MNGGSMLRKLSLVALVSAVVVASALLAAPAPTGISAQTPRAVCGTADPDGVRTVFLVSDTSGNPVPGVIIAAGGSSEATNTTGIAVLSAGNFTDFSVVLSGMTFQGHLPASEYPAVCAGSSYYRLVSFQINGDATD